MTSETGVLLDAVAAHGLPGATLALPDRPLEGVPWAELLRGAVAQRVTGPLLTAIDDGRLPALDSQRDDVRAAHRTAMATAMRLERTATEATDVLDAARIESRVLKGPALAHLDYPDPSLRAFGDVDLLVRGEDYDEAVIALAAVGVVRRLPELRAGFDRRYGKGATLVGPGGLEVDLHRTFVAGPFGMTVDLDSLFAGSRRFVVGGRTLLALADTPRFLHACYHAGIGRGVPRLVPLRDVAQLALSEALDARSVLEEAARWRCEAVVARAVAATWVRFALADVTPLSVWAERYRPDPDEERMLVGYTGDDWSFGAQAIAAVKVIPGLRAKAGYVHALALPRREALRGRGQRNAVRWRRGVRLARRYWSAR